MCGIFATTADKNAPVTILKALKSLEYRGYDSWGIVVRSKTLEVEKHVGRISVSRTTLPKTVMGIGHTRWATHGGVTDPNAHPHLDCGGKVAIVHNGIIDNWQALKKMLKKHRFRSQTDSEIVAHLIEEYLESGQDLFEATKTAFRQLQGLNAILVMHRDFEYLVTAKTGSPIVMGVNPGNNLVSSDTASLLPFTQKVIYLEDGQIAKVEKDMIKVVDLGTDQEIKPGIVKIQWSAEQAYKGKYDHYMLKEIYEQPEVIEALLSTGIKETKRLAQLIKGADEVFSVACGTAAYAALAGQYFFSRIAGFKLNPAIGSEFYYHADFLNKKSLCIALSQSGETIDTIQSINFAKERGAKTAALINVPGSTLGRLTDLTVSLEAGPEKAVASTKAFVAKLVLLLMTAHQLNSGREMRRELKMAVKSVRQVLHQIYQEKVTKIADTIKKQRSIFILGRGQSYPAALEIALKIKEISYIHAEGFPAGELKHGVIALIEKGTPVIVLAPNDETYHDVLSAAMEVKARGAMVIGISHQDNPVFDFFLKVVDAGNATIIPNVVVGQTLAYQLAVARGFDPDMPRNLAKSVTVK